MMVLGSRPIIKRLFSTLVLILGRTPSSASTLSDSLPVCRIERLPTPCSSTSSKPLTFLDSLATSPGSLDLSSGPWPLVSAEEITCEKDELPCPPDPEDKEATEETPRFRR